MASSSWHLLTGGIVNCIILFVCCVDNIFWLARASRIESDGGLPPILAHPSEPFKSRNKKGRIDASSPIPPKNLEIADPQGNGPSELRKDQLLPLLKVRCGSQRRPSSSSPPSQSVKPQLESNKTRRYSSRKRPSSTRISRAQEKYNKEIDAYIDFLIATYCPDDDDNDNHNDNDQSLVQNVVSTNTKMMRKSQRKRRMQPQQKQQTQSSAASRKNSGKRSEVSRSSGLVTDPSVSPALPDNNLETSNTQSTTKPPEEDTSEYKNVMQKQDHQESSSWNSTMQFNQEERLVRDSSSKNNNGGSDDDGDSEDDDMVTDAELLDQYIEFLQQDYEQDKALDQYIEFLQQDYDKDRALDQYIDFLLATTTASVPVTRTASSRSLQNLTTTSAHDTTTESVDTSPAMTQGTVVNAEEIIVVYPVATEEATDNSLSETIKKELDAYIDQLVTAVELDEYIDRLVESVSTASREAPTPAEEEEEEEPKDEEAIDSNIHDLVSSSKAPSLEQPLDIMPTEPISERLMETTASTSSLKEPAIDDEKEKAEVVITAAKLSKKKKKKTEEGHSRN